MLAAEQTAAGGVPVSFVLYALGGLCGSLGWRMRPHILEQALEKLPEYEGQTPLAHSAHPDLPDAKGRNSLAPGEGLQLFAARHKLTEREKSVLLQLFMGLSTEDIMNKLGISLHTVRKHISNILRKSGAGSRQKLMADFIAWKKHTE